MYHLYHLYHLYHRKISPTIFVRYYWLSLIIIVYHWLLLIFIDYHWLSWLSWLYLNIRKTVSNWLRYNLKSRDASASKNKCIFLQYSLLFLPRFFSPPREIYYPSRSNSLPPFPIFFSKNTISSPIFSSFNYSNPLGEKNFITVPNIFVLILLCFSLPQGSLFFVISVYQYW